MESKLEQNVIDKLENLVLVPSKTEEKLTKRVKNRGIKKIKSSFYPENKSPDVRMSLEMSKYFCSKYFLRLTKESASSNYTKAMTLITEGLNHFRDNN